MNLISDARQTRQQKKKKKKKKRTTLKTQEWLKPLSGICYKSVTRFRVKQFIEYFSNITHFPVCEHLHTSAC